VAALCRGQGFVVSIVAVQKLAVFGGFAAAFAGPCRIVPRPCPFPSTGALRAPPMYFA
jgi:hypothetical protein